MPTLNIFHVAPILFNTHFGLKNSIFWCILIQTVVVKKLGSCQLNIHPLKYKIPQKEINLFSLTYLFH